MSNLRILNQKTKLKDFYEQEKKDKAERFYPT